MNGMSSETISITVCGDCHPCCSKSGLYTRTFASPGARCWARFQCATAAP